jgi:hypothetical protein
MNTVEDLISEKTIEAVFGRANFGVMSKRSVIKYSLLKCASGYETGHTVKCILEELGLVNVSKWKLTKSGKEYLFAAFSEGISV